MSEVDKCINYQNSEQVHKTPLSLLIHFNKGWLQLLYSVEDLCFSRLLSLSLSSIQMALLAWETYVYNGTASEIDSPQHTSTHIHSGTSLSIYHSHTQWTWTSLSRHHFIALQCLFSLSLMSSDFKRTPISVKDFYVTRGECFAKGLYKTEFVLVVETGETCVWEIGGKDGSHYWRTWNYCIFYTVKIQYVSTRVVLNSNWRQSIQKKYNNYNSLI